MLRENIKLHFDVCFLKPFHYHKHMCPISDAAKDEIWRIWFPKSILSPLIVLSIDHVLNYILFTDSIIEQK